MSNKMVHIGRLHVGRDDDTYLVSLFEGEVISKMDDLCTTLWEPLIAVKSFSEDLNASGAKIRLRY